MHGPGHLVRSMMSRGKFEGRTEEGPHPAGGRRGADVDPFPPLRVTVSTVMTPPVLLPENGLHCTNNDTLLACLSIEQYGCSALPTCRNAVLWSFIISVYLSILSAFVIPCSPLPPSTPPPLAEHGGLDAAQACAACGGGTGEKPGSVGRR